MPTIGRKWPKRSSPPGDYSAMCDYCGVMWRRSQLRKDRAGLLACPDEGDGADVVTLSEANAADAGRPRLFSRVTDGANFDNDGDGTQSPVHLHRTTAADIEVPDP